jgi:glutamate 5-kinase
VTASRRVVVKVGSSSLTSAAGGLDRERLDTLVDALEAERARGGEVVLVSSGAIAAGLAPLGLTGRPRDLATLQAAASVGQTQLVERYAVSFGRYGRTVGQVLLTVDDVVRRAHYKNAQRTLDRLIQLGVVPVINENDTVATHEIRFGDNDRLAALVAHLVQADLLVLLSDIDGLYDSDPRLGEATLIPLIDGETDLAGVQIGGVSRSGVGTGGMSTKVEAARIATAAGVPVILASATAAMSALSGDEVGTRFTATARRAPTRLLWLAHASEPAGRLRLDPGAVAAVVERRLSLLPAGITAAEGAFSAGDPVDLLDENGHARARGLVNYDSGELPGMLGRSTRELAARLGPAYEREVVHRDDIVLLP